MNIRYGALAGGLLLCLAGDAFADRDRTFILATGRRDPRMYAIDLQKALRPENNNTSNAIISRSKTALGPGFCVPRVSGPLRVSERPPSPVPLLSPNPGWGCFPDTNGIAIGHGSDGKSYLFTANGGTDDVSVIHLERALAGDRRAELRQRIPTQIGPWGIAASPDRRYIVAANRERHASP